VADKENKNGKNNTGIDLKKTLSTNNDIPQMSKVKSQTQGTTKTAKAWDGAEELHIAL